MSLGRLLATGRSLAGGPSVGRYNVSERNRLPKFNAAKNPFAQPAPKQAGQPEVVKSSETAHIQTPPPVAAPAPMSMPQETLSPFSAAASSQPARPVPSMNGAKWLARALNAKAAVVALMKRLPSLVKTTGNKLAEVSIKVLALLKNQLGRVKPVRRKEPQSVIPRFGKPAIQGELSLDKVKVVCNDLEESDLEIVTAQTNTSAQVAPSVAPPEPKRGPMPSALKKISNRMLGVKLS